MKKIIFLLSAMALILTTEMSHAEDKYGLTVTPRFQYQIMAINMYGSGAGGLTEQHEDLTVPSYGLTLQYAPKSLPNFDFQLTGWTSKGSGNLVSAQAGCTNSNTTGCSLEVTTTEGEFLVRQRLDETSPWALQYGLTYRNMDSSVIVPGIPGYSDVNFKLFMAKFGLTFATATSEDKKHYVFGGAAVAVGMGKIKYREWDTVGLQYTSGNRKDTNPYALDLNVGYQYRVSTAFSVHARYRTQVFFINSSDQFGNNTWTMHGAEVGFSYNF